MPMREDTVRRRLLAAGIRHLIAADADEDRENFEKVLTRNDVRSLKLLLVVKESQ
jgi:hypothetical protein